ncbi:hypothetical protein PMAYCL1PPCAC_29620, partial [Pristionchus mayeri]
FLPLIITEEAILHSLVVAVSMGRKVAEDSVVLNLMEEEYLAASIDTILIISSLDQMEKTPLQDRMKDSLDRTMNRVPSLDLGLIILLGTPTRNFPALDSMENPPAQMTDS